MTQINIIQGDITTLKVDAIVNAANKTLLGGSGVDGAIHLAAGRELYNECKNLGGCHTGEAKITLGYKLPAQYVIHTVGPVYGYENGKDTELLTDCYKNSLLLAQMHSIRSIAFPAISTGIFRFPKDDASKIALSTVKEFIDKHPVVFDDIYFVLYDELSFNIYKNLFVKIGWSV